MIDHSQRLGSESIARLLLRLSAPATVGMLVQAFYNLTDTIFVGHGVGALAIAGIAVSFPVQIIVMAFAQTIGIGSASIVSRSLGAGEPDRADRTLGNLYTLTILSSLAIATLGSIFLTPLLGVFGATESILPFGREYLRVILFGTPFFIFAMATNAVVRAEGNARVAMWTMIISGLLNIALDPLFIYGFGLGVGGAALATVIAQATTVLYLLYYFLGRRSTLRPGAADLRLDRRIVWEMTSIGVGSGLRSAAGSVTTIILNNALARYGGDLAIAAFGVINRLLMFFLLPMFGVIQGMMPIVGFNYGSHRIDRARRAVRLTTISTTAFSTVVTVLLAAAPASLLRVFTQDADLIALGVSAVRIVVIALPTVGFQIMAAGMYQALGFAFPALVLALLRQVLLLAPLIAVLPRFLGLRGIWIAFPIADGLAAAVTAWMVFRGLRLLRAPAGAAPELPVAVEP